ncbi:hypothetical protein ACIBG7_30700 [Nonomuraea sp. NPDC050328]|uniref:hypothetical protein n=1 Tax=Nonomuraea sp. NPDC050328 TaxID=3364361 RepID=UPI0037AAE446
MSVTLALTAQDKSTLRSAAYGAVSLIAAADAVGKPHKAATRGSLTLAAATGPIGHVLAAKTNDLDLSGRSAAALADHVLPALTQAVRLLDTQDPTLAADYRATVLTAVEAAAGTHHDRPGPVVADMIRKITGALDAA